MAAIWLLALRQSEFLSFPVQFAALEYHLLYRMQRTIRFLAKEPMSLMLFVLFDGHIGSGHTRRERILLDFG